MERILAGPVNNVPFKIEFGAAAWVGKKKCGAIHFYGCAGVVRPVRAIAFEGDVTFGIVAENNDPAYTGIQVNMASILPQRGVLNVGEV